MGAVQSCVVASLTVCSGYLFYVHIYSSRTALKTRVLDNSRLPSSIYLYMRYLIRAVSRRKGQLYRETPGQGELVYTAINCRLDSALLRSFCSAAGYGWDYPDTEYRDVPLCFPEFLCHRLMLMVLTDRNFRISPAGLVLVHQSLKTFEPVDELKKGPFMLEVRVLDYRQIDAGVEVDISHCATARTGSRVWESVLTLLSKHKFHKVPRSLVMIENTMDQPVQEDLKQVQLRVPRTAGLQSVWSLSYLSPYRLLCVLAGLFGFRSQTSASLWMLSVCLAEIEKHKGVEVITAPANVMAQFLEPLSTRGKVLIRFWDTTEDGGPSFTDAVRFHVQQDGGKKSHMVGSVSRFLAT